jgi:hypothetical protein
MKTILKSCSHPAFVLCVVTLALAAGSKEAAIRWFGDWMTKLPIPLRKSLDDLDETRLAPYRVTRKSKIENADILESLGTDNYIQWELEDTEAAASSAVRYCSLFITYYTGNPDRVPHVPEECVTGAGDTMISRDAERLRVTVGETRFEDLDKDGDTVRLPVRYLMFLRNPRSIWETEEKYAVIYFFKANGRFASSRMGTRRILGENLLGRYSYFSKVEWKFYGIGPGGPIHGTREEILAASEKLMSHLLPLLETEHWPDWEAANQAEERV